MRAAALTSTGSPPRRNAAQRPLFDQVVDLYAPIAAVVGPPEFEYGRARARSNRAPDRVTPDSIPLDGARAIGSRWKSECAVCGRPAEERDDPAVTEAIGMPQKRPSRRPRSKAELLPLPAALVRDISLENHLALATMRAGHGTPETMIALLRELYLAFFIVEPTVADADLALFLEAEAALQQSIETAGQGREWCVSDDALALIERLLLRADAIVGSVPKYRYLEA
ncbi:hypothetical protein [Burkholderia ubonensis]|uniref:hypothetical protein n=1 Tax=Burkholderia ubonensis TaxID=101571 RepID=UPI000B19C29C|nr:hypothetical protein [Burkholderia ubonensis]